MNGYTWAELHVGRRAHFDVTIAPSMLEQFVAITCDVNPLHIESTWARSRGFDRRIVHGLLTTSFFSTLAGVHLPGKHCLLHGVRVDFKAPVYVGDRLRVSGEIVHRNEAFRQIEIACSIENQQGKTVSRGTLHAGVMDVARPHLALVDTHDAVTEGWAK